MVQKITRTHPASIEKYKQLILNTIKCGGSPKDGKITKTKLAKLVYLADFVKYYYYLEPMNGAFLNYKKFEQGPVPFEYFEALEELRKNEIISIDERGNAQMISLKISKVPHDLLNSQDINLIKKICAKWRDENTEKIVKFTHDQFPWKISRQDESIPYELITQEDVKTLY